MEFIGKIEPFSKQGFQDRCHIGDESFRLRLKQHTGGSDYANVETFRFVASG